jgi:hypothetical protein
MRELTKSTLSAGLAMSLFGMQTMMNAFRMSPTGGPNPAQAALDAVTQTMVDQTGKGLRETFQVGDKVQRMLVDLSFEFLTLAPLRPGRGMSMMTDTTRRATEQMSRWMGGMGMGMGNGRGSDCGCSGAAPMRAGAWSATAPSQSSPGGAAGGAWGPMPDQS